MTGRVGTRLAVGGLLLACALLGSFLLERRETTTPADAARAARIDAADIPFAEQQDRVRVEVLNGAGESGAAAAVTDSLRAAGFDVKTYGNAGSFDVPVTYVVDRSGRGGAAARVAEHLRGAEIRVELDPDLYLDATVVLGTDWRSRISRPPTP